MSNDLKENEYAKKIYLEDIWNNYVVCTGQSRVRHGVACDLNWKLVEE